MKRRREVCISLPLFSKDRRRWFKRMYHVIETENSYVLVVYSSTIQWGYIISLNECEIRWWSSEMMIMTVVKWYTLTVICLTLPERALIVRVRLSTDCIHNRISWIKGCWVRDEISFIFFVSASPLFQSSGHFPLSDHPFSQQHHLSFLFPSVNSLWGRSCNCVFITLLLRWSLLWLDNDNKTREDTLSTQNTNKPLAKQESAKHTQNKTAFFPQFLVVILVEPNPLLQELRYKNTKML